VDCISSLAGDEIDCKSIDIAVGTANKCIQGIPGVSFVLLRKKDLERLRKIPERTLYFDLTGYHKAQEKGGLLFTPAIPAYYALDVALDELIEETVQGRVQRYANAAKFLRAGFKDIGLEFLIPEGWRSNCLTGLRLPEGVSYEKLHAELKGNGFVIYAGQGILSDNIFRIANMGDINQEEFQRFLKELKTIC
jgi:2-aminoethylphosphonate-pyruvate transaminase